ncbi:contractile injection system protein, VgrG/Pvc8 family [Collimonas sp. NPDC087041]|uniref:contractile injection system protein, VgrG/Pvc8 family n=1 Tax=Collimonas sp. NPDC087041 TaxID=3363960 RepID=UPI00382F3550
MDMPMDYPAPAFKITLDGLDLTPKFAPRLVNLSLTEFRSDNADELRLSLSDADGLLALPPKGARINVQIGWRDSGLVDKGEFTVDEVEHAGTPDVLTLHARAASLIDTLRQPMERSFHDTTLGAVIEVIAFQQELTAGIAEALRAIPVKHLDQTRESDAAFLRRLGKKYDALATVKNGTLLFMPAGRSKTASGRDLPTVQITRQDGDKHRYHSAERNSYSGVRAYWYDDRHSLRRSVVAGVPGNSKRLRTTYANEADARTAAVAEWQRIQRGAATFELSLALGNPALTPQSPVVVSGWKEEIDHQEWLVGKTTHNLSDAGLTTDIECETRTEEASAEREDQADPDPGITGVIAKWRDKVSKKQGEQLAGSRNRPKTLPHIYTSKQSAVRSAKLEWAKIQERREIVAENDEAA